MANEIGTAVKTVQDVVVNRWTVGGGLALCGLAVAVGWSMDWFSQPLVWGISLMTLAGVFTAIVGIAILTQTEVLGVKATA
jgi:hypothetical protein